MLRRAAKPDWFIVDQETIRPIAATPGIQLVKGSIEIHRSHLPLLDSDDAMRALSSWSNTWEERDKATAPLGFTLRRVQHTAVDFIRRRAGTLLADDMRVGKAERNGSLVLTVAGWRAIEELTIGDEVFGSDGNAHNVTGVFPRGKLAMFRVTFSDGASVVVNDDHLWSGWANQNYHRGYAPITKSTAELRNLLHQRWRIPLVSPIQFSKRELPIEPYILGVLLGDGALSMGGVTFTPGDEAVPAEVAKRLPAGMRLEVRRPCDHAAVWRIVDDAKENRIRRALNEHGLTGLSWEKFVPEMYLFSSIAQRLALLRGLMDTDGELSFKSSSTNDNRHPLVAFSSASEALVDAVRFLVESFGGVARKGYRAVTKYTYQDEQRFGRPSWRLNISMPPGISPFLARSGYVDRVKFTPARFIRSIEPEGEAEATCISVDAPDHLYVTENFIVTHNTLSCIYSHEPHMGRLVVIAPLMTREVWLGWMRRVFPGEDIGVMVGRKFDPVEAAKPIVFGHYDILYGWQTGQKIGTLVLDEAHELSNPRSRRSIAVGLLANRAERVIAATGTPIWNMPTKMWNILALIAPGAFGSYYDFGDRFGAPEQTAYGTRYTGLSNESELSLRLTEVMLRRRWQDVCDDLPAITRNTVIVDLTNAQRRKLDIVAEGMRQGTTNTAGALARYRDALSMIKIDATISEIERCLDNDEPIVVWTWHRNLADAITELLLAGGRQAFKLTGDTPMKGREKILADWRQGAGALVVNMAVGQVGIDLSHAHRAVFAEIDYTPGMIAQAEMRTFAPTRPMNVTYIMCDHFVDRKLAAALLRKLEVSTPLGVGVGEGAIASIDAAFRGPEEVADLDRLMADLLS